MSFLKGAAHLLLIWFAIVAVLTGTAFLMVTFDLMRDVTRDIQPAHYNKGAV
ncbi:hypothetical protein H3V53_06160 [Paraburkholderia bengalensis]|uniref:Uncharacterized protein n=1 Tax=Paraburkholderia bengalensis TaxID=2747562 RepID=A0ABU8IMM7_9BURK